MADRSVFARRRARFFDAMGEGVGFADALAQVQAEGYAEADPSHDIDGHDAAAKTAAGLRLVPTDLNWSYGPPDAARVSRRRMVDAAAARGAQDRATRDQPKGNEGLIADLIHASPVIWTRCAARSGPALPTSRVETPLRIASSGHPPTETTADGEA